MKYFTDGYLFLSNPSPIGGGYTIVDNDNWLVECVKINKIGFTNNEAELLGIYNTLKIANVGDVISSDSQITVNWVKQDKLSKKRARRDLDHIKIAAHKLMIDKKINLIWEPREKNLAGIFNEERELDDSIPDDELDLSWI